LTRSNPIWGRILLGSAIGGLLGLILLAMGIAIVLNAVKGRVSPAPPQAEIQQIDPYYAPDPTDEDQGEEGWDDAEPDHPMPQGPYEDEAYPSDTGLAPSITVQRPAEPLPDQARSQWRSIFENDAPVPPPPPRAATPAPAPRAPAAPRSPPQPSRDEESLFY